MTPDQQRIAIAEYCGWSLIEYRESLFSRLEWLSGLNPNPQIISDVIDAETMERRDPNESDYGWESLPDYLNDLNAIHEAEKSLPKGGASLLYVEALATLQSDHHPFFSTASEKAQAFLIAIGKLD